MGEDIRNGIVDLVWYASTTDNEAEGVCVATLNFWEVFNILEALDNRHKWLAKSVGELKARSIAKDPNVEQHGIDIQKSALNCTRSAYDSISDVKEHMTNHYHTKKDE